MILGANDFEFLCLLEDDKMEKKVKTSWRRKLIIEAENRNDNQK